VVSSLDSEGVFKSTELACREGFFDSPSSLLEERVNRNTDLVVLSNRFLSLDDSGDILCK
jgi:hypothetical protein